VRRADVIHTEATDPVPADLDRRPAADIVRAVVEGHDDVLAAVRPAEARARLRACGAAVREAMGS